MKRKIVVLGLDGVTFSLITPWVRQGYLPSMQRILEHGAWGTLSSTLPPLSAQAWTTMVTGRNMAQHGIVDFIARSPGKYSLEFLNGGHRTGKAIWDILSDAGFPVQVVNVPMTYPPQPVNGTLVAGMDAPSVSTHFTYPPTLRDELLSTFPDYRIELRPFSKLHGTKQDYAGVLQEALELEETRFKVMRHLENRFAPEFTMTVFRLADVVQHWFWKHMDPSHPHRRPGDEKHSDAILQAYQKLDSFVGWYLDHLTSQDILIIVSDHGFGPVGDRAVHLNVWLQEQGWLAFRKQAGQSFVRALWSTWTLARRFTPRSIKEWLLKRFSRARAKVPATAAFSGIDWDETKAYALEVREAIYINVKGREPRGIVEPGEEYEHLRDEIARRLEQWRDPLSGDCLVKRVHRREELYDGPLLEWIPDLIIEWAGLYPPTPRYSAAFDRSQAVRVLPVEKTQTQPRPNGTHRREGVLMMYGGPIIHRELQARDLVDVAPTICYLAELPIPTSMDGETIVEAIHTDYLSVNPVRVTEGIENEPTKPSLYSESDEEEIAERLRGLGYID